jgi:hypothetical protein
VLVVRVQELAGDCLREIAIRLLHLEAIGEVHHVALESEFIGVAPRAFKRAG